MFALCTAFVIGCAKPSPLVNVNVSYTPPPHAASSAAVPSGSNNEVPANFTPDPGFTQGGNTIGVGGNKATFECCLGHDWSSSSADPQTWNPGQQIRITWVESVLPAAGSREDTMFLTAKMYGPWRSVAALSNGFMSSDGPPIAAARVVRWSTRSARTASSLITIPANAKPGYYDLQFSAAAHEIGYCGTDACAPGFYDGAIIYVN